MNYEARNRKINSETIDESYTEDILKIRSNETINQFVHRNPPKNNYDALQFILTIKENTRNHTSFYWGISLKDHPNLIGTICLWNFSEDPGKKQKSVMNYYRSITEKESCRKLWRQSWILHLKNLHLQEIIAMTHKLNENSKGLLLKHDFVLQEDRKDEDFPENLVFSLKK